jgi:hypothetical protein
MAGALLAPALLMLGVSAAEGSPTVTIVEGAGSIGSAGEQYRPAPGVRLRQCDLLRAEPQGLMQVEFDDGTALVLGHDSGLVVDLPGAGPSVAGMHVLVSGWAKLTVPGRDAAAPHRLDTPHFDVLMQRGTAVVHVDDRGGEVFVEQGSAIVTGSDQRQVTVAAGRTYARQAARPEGVVGEGARKAFLDGMPQAFRDTLPSLIGRFKGRDVPLVRAGNGAPPDAGLSLAAIPELRHCTGDAMVRRAQEALQRHGIAVGPIDGIHGPRTQAALREFQARRGLAPSGQLDPVTLRALDAGRP